ncbi:MAG: hypothetical protein Kow0068_11750 [Marinilabiliales bacterium]
MPYLDIGEFYSEFGNYEVSITLPDNYIVAATGNLQNEEEIKMLESLIAKTEKIRDFNDIDLSFPKSSKNLKTITFKENNIHDFAWFADKRFLVLKSHVKLPNSGKTVNTYAYFTGNEAYLWKDATKYINDAIYYYSKWYGDYPYNNCTAVEAAGCAGGGMEYPTITLIGSADNDLSLEEVIMHEVGHNWFYGVLGSNERDHPWMDEGINSFSELRYMQTKYPELKLYQSLDMSERFAKRLELHNLPDLSKYEISYLLNARRGLDQACNLKSEDYSSINYFTIVYMKSAFVFNFLKEYLGEKEFDKLMKLYYEKWKFKHPYPNNFIDIFKSNCSKNLDWFFDGMLTTNNKIDYKIKNVKKTDSGNYIVNIKNKSSIMAPVPLSVIKNGVETEKYFIEPQTKTTSIELKTKDFDYVCIDHNHIFPDIYKRNNYYYQNKLFHRWKPCQIKFFTAYENPEKKQFFYMPVIGWNNNNGLMTGLAFYNYLVLMKKFEFSIIPMYGFKNKNIAGQAQLDYHILPEKYFKRIDFTASAKQYAYNENYNFQRYYFNGDFRLKNENSGKFIDNVVSLSAFIVSNTTELLLYNQYNYKGFVKANFSHVKNRIVNPYNYNLTTEGNNDYTKIWFTGNYRLSYSNINKGLDIRVFAGFFLFNKLQDALVNFRLSGWTAVQDYTYSNYFIDRTSNPADFEEYNLANSQFVIEDGGFKTYTGFGQTDKWLTSICIETDLPVPVPMKIFGSIGTYPNNNYHSYSFRNNVEYEAGIAFALIKNIFTIYYPLVVSENISFNHDYIYDNNLQKIRFTLNLNRINVLNILRNFNL